jgi:hypothetical protein
MPLSLSLLQAQTDDYQTLLTATEALLGDELAEMDVADYLILRDRCLASTMKRETALMEALMSPAGARLETAMNIYRDLLQALVAADARLLATAEACQGELGKQLRSLGENARGLSGYHSGQRGGEAQALSQRV